MKFNIIICTYNRVDILKITLPCYNSLKVPEGVDLEVIIVDNNSNDETAGYVDKFITKGHSRIKYRYIAEPRQGLSYARNTGYKNASGDYIAYMDDECIIPENWLNIAFQDVVSERPAFLGGPYYGKYLPAASSIWYKESFGDSYILQYNLATGPMKSHYLSGGNIVVRKDVFDKIGLFNTELGMSGVTINFGEEQDFQKRLIAKYPRELIWYNSSLFVWHYIREEKMSVPYLFKVALIRGESSAKAGNQTLLNLVISPFLLVFFITRAVLSALWKLILSLFTKEHFFTLLHEDYKSRFWRSIGVSWYRSKILLKKILLPFSNTKKN